MQHSSVFTWFFLLVLTNSIHAISFFRTDDLKEGRLVGQDAYGNKYYENNKYFYGESGSLACSFIFAWAPLLGRDNAVT